MGITITTSDQWFQFLNQLIIPMFTLIGVIIGGVIGYYIEKLRQVHEERVRRTNEIKAIYRQVAFSLLKRYKSVETEKMDDAFLQNFADIMLCDDKQDPISKSMIILTNDSWNETQKYLLIKNEILPEMRTRLKELSQENAQAKRWWQFWGSE